MCPDVSVQDFVWNFRLKIEAHDPIWQFFLQIFQKPVAKETPPRFLKATAQHPGSYLSVGFSGTAELQRLTTEYVQSLPVKVGLSALPGSFSRRLENYFCWGLGKQRQGCSRCKRHGKCTCGIECWKEDEGSSAGCHDEISIFGLAVTHLNLTWWFTEFPVYVLRRMFHDTEIEFRHHCHPTCIRSPWAFLQLCREWKKQPWPCWFFSRKVFFHLLTGSSSTWGITLAKCKVPSGTTWDQKDGIKLKHGKMKLAKEAAARASRTFLAWKQQNILNWRFWCSSNLGRRPWERFIVFPGDCPIDLSRKESIYLLEPVAALWGRTPPGKLPLLFLHHSHIVRDSYAHGIGIVWVAYQYVHWIFSIVFGGKPKKIWNFERINQVAKTNLERIELQNLSFKIARKKTETWNVARKNQKMGDG